MDRERGLFLIRVDRRHPHQLLPVQRGPHPESRHVSRVRQPRRHHVDEPGRSGHRDPRVRHHALRRLAVRDQGQSARPGPARPARRAGRRGPALGPGGEPNLQLLLIVQPAERGRDLLQQLPEPYRRPGQFRGDADGQAQHRAQLELHPRARAPALERQRLQRPAAERVPRQGAGDGRSLGCRVLRLRAGPIQ